MRLELHLMSDGWCEQQENIAIHGGAKRRIRFAAMFGLILHPKAGPILFDTGYTRRFLAETEKFPAKFYRLITPVFFNEAGDVKTQLLARNLSPADVRHIVVSHFHADHVGGLKDFPNAKFHCSRAAFEAVKNLRGFGATRHAFLPGLLPEKFPARAVFFEDAATVKLPATHAPFSQARDVLGDGSLLAVELPGHATGQIGVFLKDASGRDCLLAADACWLSQQFRENRMPHGIVRLLVNWSDYKATLQKLHELHKNNPAMRIIPTHCAEIWSEPA